MKGNISKNTGYTYTKQKLAGLANALKATKTGCSLLLDDISPVEHEMSVRVSSKNLIPYPYAKLSLPYGASYTNNDDGSITLNGITFKDNGDGTITFNGTATAGTTIFILVSGASLQKGKQYVLSGCPNNGSETTYYLYAQPIRNGTMYGNYSSKDYGSSAMLKNYSWSSDSDLQLRIEISQDASMDNLIFKPQVEEGTTATEWTAYVSPSAVNVKSYGKNLIPYPYYDTTKTVCGVTFTDNGDGSITVSGTATSYASFTMCGALSPLPLTVVPGTTYTFSSLAVSAENIVYSITERNNQEQITTYTCEPNKNFTFTVSKNTTALSIIIKRKNDGIECKGTFCHHMLELGTSATEYENYVEPTVYTPQADGKVNGVKNIYPTTTLLCDTDGVVIDVEYNRDINKAFEELKNAILSQGGNV